MFLLGFRTDDLSIRVIGGSTLSRDPWARIALVHAIMARFTVLAEKQNPTSAKRGVP